jgi:hypothetical protein
VLIQNSAFWLKLNPKSIIYLPLGLPPQGLSRRIYIGTKNFNAYAFSLEISLQVSAAETHARANFYEKIAKSISGPI